MNCSETKPKLGFYLDQTLPDNEMQQLRGHLDACKSCTTAFQNLGKMECVIQAGIYFEPPHEYWRDVPQTIIKKIGIRAETSALEQFIESTHAFFAAKSFRWGFAGAFAVAILAFFFSKTFIPDQKSATLTQAELMSQSGSTPALVDLNKDQKTASFDSEKSQVGNEETNLIAKGPVSELVTKLQDSNAGSREIAITFLSEDLLALNRVKGKPLKTESREILGVNRALFPIPNTEFILPPRTDDVQDANSRLQRTFALDKQDARSSRADAISDLPDEIKRIRSGFLETLWIVQESQTLTEKRNIWLSYMNRETDITYQSLAVYNLALVLARIAEENKYPDDAAEARSFFLEYEEALRFQMGDERFDDKLNLFDVILAN